MSPFLVGGEKHMIKKCHTCINQNKQINEYHGGDP